MQATSPVYRATTDTGWMAPTSLVIMAIFAAIVVLAILYGMRLRAQRRAARKIEEARVEAETPSQPLAAPEAVAAPSEPKPEPAPAPTPPPVAPAPPPLDTWAAPGTPAADPLPDSPDVADEPIAAAAPFEASPAMEAESAPDEPAVPNPGERPLTTLKGLGPKVAARLEELGVTNVGDLAALDDTQAAGVDARLGPFTGRMARDRWLEQARLLAAGDDKGFEAVFGKL